MNLSSQKEVEVVNLGTESKPRFVAATRRNKRRQQSATYRASVQKSPRALRIGKSVEQAEAERALRLAHRKLARSGA